MSWWSSSPSLPPPKRGTSHQRHPLLQRTTAGWMVPLGQVLARRDLRGGGGGAHGAAVIGGRSSYKAGADGCTSGGTTASGRGAAIT